MDFRLNATEAMAWLNSPEGPVGRYLDRLDEELVSVARAKVRVRRIPDRYRTGLTSDARPPGFTLASIRDDKHHDAQGLLYGGARAAGDATDFLEDPAEQLHQPYPFLTTALDVVRRAY